MNTLLLDLALFSVPGLIAVFVNVACYLVLLGMSFMGITYLIIYVAGIILTGGGGS